MKSSTASNYDTRGVPRVPEQFREFHDTMPLPDGDYGVIEVGQYDRLYRNNGDNTFTNVANEAGITGNYKGLAATWWDYNQDRYPDIYVANDFYGPDRLYRNNGDGTFTDVAAQALPHTPWFSMGCDAGDINNDGLFDLIATDMSERTTYRSKVAMNDMVDDAWFLERPTPRQYMRNAVFLNTGVGRMSGNRPPHRAGKHGLDLVGPPGRPRPGRPARPAHHQRHEPRLEQHRHQTRGDAPRAQQFGSLQQVLGPAAAAQPAKLCVPQSRQFAL